MKLHRGMLWLHVICVMGVQPTQVQRLGRWACSAGNACYCHCGVAAPRDVSLVQVARETPFPPLPPPALPPYPPARLPAMPTFTSMTEDDLPTLGPPPPTTPLPTLPPTPAPMTYPFSPKAQANMLRGKPGAVEEQNYHQYTFQPRALFAKGELACRDL